MKKFISFISIILIISSCGPTKEIRRSNRAAKKLDKIVQKYPELIKKDTIQGIVYYEPTRIIIDTVFGFKVDTAYIDSGTAIITVLPPNYLEYKKEGITLKLNRVDSGKHWRYKLTADIKLDTVMIPYEVFVDRIAPVKYKPMPMKKWQTFAIGSGILLWVLLLLAVILLLVKFLKPL